MRHPRSQLPQYNRSSGFTLIEVLLTVTIMAIISIAGMSSIIDLQRTSRVNQTVTTYRNYLELARSYAITGKRIKSKDASILPEFFGVGIKTKDASCANNEDNLILFATTNNSSPTYDISTEKNVTVLDNFCVSPKVAYQRKINNSVASANLEMLYAPPFGNFSFQTTTSTESGQTKTIEITVCDKGTASPSGSNPCPTNNYQKTLTLFSNVGVPEEL